MKNSVQILQANSDQGFSSLSNSHLLIDTNFLFDAIHYPNSFQELIENIKKSGCTLITLDAVLYEFTKGSKSLEEYAKRVGFYKTLIDVTLSVEPLTKKNISNLSRVLLRRGLHISYTDCSLLATLMRYRQGVYLLSKDRSDIVVSLFPIILNINVETSENNCMFSVYGFSQEDYGNKLSQMIKEEI